MHPEKYLRYLVPTSLFGIARTKEILTSNPITDLARQDASVVQITVYDYDAGELHEQVLQNVPDSFHLRDNN